jgi:hypothetical protein
MYSPSPNQDLYVGNHVAIGRLLFPQNRVITTV